MQGALGGFDLGFVFGSVFGATIAWVSGYIVMRRWSLVDLARVMDVARTVARTTAHRAVSVLVPDATQRGTVDLKPGVVPPLGDRPTRVYLRKTLRPAAGLRACTDPEHDVSVRSQSTDGGAVADDEQRPA